MDALAKLNENFLSCNICTEIFKDPCTIGCYHTFCRECLAKYTKSRRDAITAKSILCPNCNQMTKVPRPQEPVEQWCQQFKPSFLIQGLLDTFASQQSSDPIEHCCFTCQQLEKTTPAKTFCEDCGIIFCENCSKIHVAAPNGADHVVATFKPGELPSLKTRKAMCTQHKSLIEFCCSDCQKAVCSKCCIFYHRKCQSVVTIESMIPEMKQVLQENCDDIDSHLQQIENALHSRRSEVEDITQQQSSLQSEIRRVGQQAVDLIRRKEKKLLDELGCITERHIGLLRSQIKADEVDMQTFRQYTEFIKQVLQSNSPMDLYDLYALYRSGEITAEIQKQGKIGTQMTKVLFEKTLDVMNIDKIFDLGIIRSTTNMIGIQRAPSSSSTAISKSNINLATSAYRPSQVAKSYPNLVTTAPNPSSSRSEPNPNLMVSPSCHFSAIPKSNPSLQAKPKLLSTVSIAHGDDKNVPDPYDIEVLNIGGTETLVVLDFENLSVKSCYKKDNKTHCTSLKIGNKPTTVTKIRHDLLAISFFSNYNIQLVNLKPDPVHVFLIKTEKEYRCLTALSETTMAATCVLPPGIDVLNLSGRVLRSVITPSTGQQLIQKPRYMCTTGQGQIIVTDRGSHSVYCLTQLGEVLYTHKLTGRRRLPWGGVTTADTGSVIVVDYFDNKVLELTETGEYVRDLLTSEDGIQRPQGIRIHGNKLYVTEHGSKYIKIFQL